MTATKLWAVPMHGKCRLDSPSRFPEIPHIRHRVSHGAAATGGNYSKGGEKYETNQRVS